MSVRLWIIVVAFGLMGRAALAQLPPVTQAPPAITFEPWREVDRDEVSIEYAAVFPSPLLSPYPENNQVPLRVFLPLEAKGPVPVVVVLHYWGAKDLTVEQSLAGELNSRGVAAVIMTLPYHLGRTPAGHRSGDMAVQPDPDLLKASMTQATLDVRRTVDFLQTRPEFDHAKIGIAGTSLGAIVAALAYGVEPRLTHSAYMLGGVDLAKILWRSSRITAERELLRRRGLTEAKLRELLVSVEPLTYLPARAPGRSFVIGGRFDTVVPNESTEELIAALGQPKTLWIDTGHYGGIFVQQRLLRLVADFFKAEMTGGEYKAPLGIYAPTVRLVVEYNTAVGPDIGVGFDLFRSGPNGLTFGSAILTPRGPRFFLGRRVASGVSLGISTNGRRTGLGILWSTVL